MVLIHPYPVPTEGIRFQNADVEAYVNTASHGKGTLYITEAIISWINSGTGEGFKIPYKKMTLHAISRDPAVHACSCLYIMVNGTLDNEDLEEEAEIQGNMDEEETTEIRFVPGDSTVLDELYKSVGDCTLLHPDASSDMSEEEDFEDAFQDFVAQRGGGNADGSALRVINDDDYDYIEHQERQIGDLQAFLRARLRVGQDPAEGQGQANGNLSANSHNGNGNAPPLDPDEFADADE